MSIVNCHLFPIMAMLDMSTIRKGKVIKFNDQPYLILSADHSKTAQRRPVLRTKMRNLLNDSVLEYSFAQSEKAEEADLERGKPAQFLYKDDTKAYFMDQTSYEQFELPLESIENQLPYLSDGKDVMYMAFEGRPVTLDLPPKIDLRVVEAPEGVKGNSQGRVMKTAKLETGYEIQVPMFIKEGDLIRINTDDGKYVERVTEEK